MFTQLNIDMDGVSLHPFGEAPYITDEVAQSSVTWRLVTDSHFEY
jgi:hypothetical protein